MKRKTAVIFLVLSLAYLSMPAQNSIFYELSGEGIKTSYLFATIPSSDERTFNLSDSVFWAFSKSESLSVLSLTDSAQKSALENEILLPKKATATDLLNNKMFGRLDNLILDLKDRSVWSYLSWEPLFLRDKVMEWELEKSEGQELTDFFKNLAINQEKEMNSVLTVADWSEIYQNIPLELQADMLVHYLRLRKNERYYHRSLNQYLTADLDKLYRIAQQYQHTAQFHVYYRPLSEKLAEGIKNQSATKSSFYLADAAMLGGEEGLLHLLKKNGIKARPIGTGFNYSKTSGGTIPGLVTYTDSVVFEPNSSVNYYDLNTRFQDAYFEDKIPGWYKLTSYRGGFSVRMPGPPEIIKEKLPAEAGGMKMYLYRYEDSDERNLYIVSFFDYPREVEVKGSDAFFQRVIAQTVRRFDGLLLKEQNISTDEYAGREVEIKGEEEMIIRVRFYLIGQRLYQVVLSAEDKKAYSQKNEAFFNSFRILDVYRRPWFRVNTSLADVQFPDVVNEQIEVLPFEDTLATTLTYYLNSTPTNLQYSATFTLLPDRYKLDDAIDAYQKMAFKTIDQIDGILVDESYRETGDFRVLYFEAGGKQEQMIRSRVFVTREAIIQIMVFGPEDSVRSAFADRFINGYELHPLYR